MAITPTDIQFFLATTGGAAGFTTAQPDHNLSLGKYISTTAIVNAVLNNLFDSVGADENVGLESEYRLMFVLNNHATIPLLNTKVWIASEISGGAVAAISLDTTGATPKGQAGIQAKTIANENTAPAAQTFSSPTDRASGLVLGTLAAGSVQGIWVRRTATNTPPMALDGVRVRVDGDTAA